MTGALQTRPAYRRPKQEPIPTELSTVVASRTI